MYTLLFVVSRAESKTCPQQQVDVFFDSHKTPLKYIKINQIKMLLKLHKKI